MVSEVSVSEEALPNGYLFRRSDGQNFVLIPAESGHASLYLGDGPNDHAVAGIVDLDVSVADKIGRARRWALAYPKEPVED